MSEFVYIYMYTVMQNIQVMFWFVYVIGLIVSGVYYLNSSMNTNYTHLYPNGDDDHKKTKDKFRGLVKKKIVVLPFIALMVITVLIPSERDIKTIIAGGLVWKAGSSVADINGVSELPENMVKAMNAFLVGVESEDSSEL